MFCSDGPHSCLSHRSDVALHVARSAVRSECSKRYVCTENNTTRGPLPTLKAFIDERSTVDLSELKHLHSLEFMVSDSIEDSFDQIVPVIATMPSNKLRSLTISFSDTHDWQTIFDPVGHPLDDAILALGKPSVVVSVAEVKRNKPASKIVQRYLPRLHEAKLLHVQCSSGAYDMCTPPFQTFVINTSSFYSVPRRGVPPGPRDEGGSHGHLPGRSIFCHWSG